MILLTSFYDAHHEQRNAELAECYRRNRQCKAFGAIRVFLETDNGAELSNLCKRLVEVDNTCPISDVLHISPVGMVRAAGSLLGSASGMWEGVPIKAVDRMTFSAYFEYANKTFAPGTAVCLANADIWFDETLLNITEQQLDERTFFACSRWGFMNEIGGWHWDEGFDKNAPVSQDAWIFRTPITWECGPITWGTADLNFTTGHMRCDNVLSAVMQAAGYRVLNPTAPGPKSLKLHHEHRSQKHNYGTTIPGPMIFVPPMQLG